MSGQSLWMIAHHYKVDVERLRALNNMGETSTIYIGQKILIQLPQTPTPTNIVTATAPSATQAPLITPRPTAARQHATAKSIDTPPARNDSGWFLFFFALFGVGVILVILSLSARK